MPPQLRAYLESLGLRSEASEQEAWNHYHKLQTTQRVFADSLISPLVEIPAATSDEGNDPTTNRNEPQGENAPAATPSAPAAAPSAPAAQGGDVTTQRAAPTAPAAQSPATQAQPGPSVEEITQRTLAAERQRTSQLRALFNGDAPELLQRALDEGWTPEQASAPLLAEVRNRGAAVAGGGPGIHSRSHDADCTTRSLQAALLVRAGMELDHQAISGGTHAAAAVALGLPDWMCRSINDDQRQQVMELGHRYSSYTMVDMCRQALHMSGRTVPHNHELMIRAAMSTSELTNIFTANMSARLLKGYSDFIDTTAGWTSEDTDIPNFKENERAAMTKFGQLTRHARGGTAEHMDIGDEVEKYKVARYSGQFVVDEMDLIDDRFGGVDQMAPEDMGRSAAQLRPDLVYSILLANANMRDGTALFHANHANLLTGALSSTNLQSLLGNMAKQRIRNRPLNVRGVYLIVPQDLRWEAAILIKSALRQQAASGDYNPLLDESLELLVDDRIGVQGVTDPRDDTARAGSATNYFVTGRPGEGGARTIEVGYLRGRGKAPSVRSEILRNGQWGMAWDVLHDIGAKDLDWRAMAKSTGAG